MRPSPFVLLHAVRLLQCFPSTSEWTWPRIGNPLILKPVNYLTDVTKHAQREHLSFIFRLGIKALLGGFLFKFGLITNKSWSRREVALVHRNWTCGFCIAASFEQTLCSVSTRAAEHILNLKAKNIRVCSERDEVSTYCRHCVDVLSPDAHWLALYNIIDIFASNICLENLLQLIAWVKFESFESAAA